MAPSIGLDDPLANEFAAALDRVPTGPTGIFPQKNYALRDELISEERMNVIDKALEEAERKPAWPKLALALASPLALVTKGAHDAALSVSAQETQPPVSGQEADSVYKVDAWSFGLALIVILIGIGAGIAILTQWKHDRAPSSMIQLAKQYSAQWLRQLPPMDK